MSAKPVVYDRKDAGAVALLVLVALAIRLYFLQFYDVISADGISYVTIAREFIAGHGLGVASHYPPFYPILLGLASLGAPNFESAGLAVSVVMGSLLVIPVYLLGAEFYSKRAGLIAAILSLSWPTLRYWSTAVMSQATYITLLLFGIYFLWQGYKRGAWLPAVAGGVFFACAHLTRSEGVLVLATQVAVLVGFNFVRKLPARNLLPVVVTLGVFAVVFSPYCILLHELTGKWQLTGKSKIAIADALSEYLGKPDIKHDPAFQEIGYLDLFRLYPDYIRTNYLKNLGQCWREMLPWYGWLLAGIGLLAGGGRGDKLAVRAYLIATFSPLVVIIVFFFIGPEYTQAYLPVLFLWIGHALAQSLEWVLAQGSGVTPKPVVKYLAYAPVCVALVYGGWNVVHAVPADRSVPYHYTRDGGRYDDKRIGLKLDKLLPKNAVLMTRSGRMGFYSGRAYLTPPQTDYLGIVDFARKNKVNYLIATPQLLGMRPQLQFLFAPLLDPSRPFTPPPELQLISIDQEPGGLPYIVYRFTSV